MVLTSPVSSQFGLIELGALRPMVAVGLSPTEALAIMLGFRLVWTGSVWAVGAVALVLLRGEWR